VFVSYTHDSEEHMRGVRELTDRLRSNGVDAWVDQYVENRGTEWAEWTYQQLLRADLVVMVCTALYKDVVDGEIEPIRNKGARWEARFIRQHIYESGSTSKFVVVLLEGAIQEHIPYLLRGPDYYSPNDDAGYLNLYRRITGQPGMLLVGLPPESLDLSRLPRKTMAKQAKDYLKRLREETGEINVGSINRSAAQASSFPISGVYVPLHYVGIEAAKTSRNNASIHDAVYGLRPARRDQPRRLRLESALQHRRVIIQGDSGSGKSTFIRCAAFDLCHQNARTTPLELTERGFPLYVRISELKCAYHASLGPGTAGAEGFTHLENRPLIDRALPRHAGVGREPVVLRVKAQQY
jgi:hypothetical protein